MAYDHHLFIEEMHDSIFMVSKDYAMANNPRVKIYDALKSNTHILYLYANNMYG